MTAKRLSFTRFSLTASFALVAVTTGVHAALQQDGTTSTPTSTEPNPAVVRELDRLFRESGQEMPSMRRQDLPYAQTPQANRLRPQGAAARAVSSESARKPGLLMRFLGGFKRKSPEAPQAAMRPQPAEQTAQQNFGVQNSLNGLRTIPSSPKSAGSYQNAPRVQQSIVENNSTPQSTPVVSATQSRTTERHERGISHPEAAVATSRAVPSSNSGPPASGGRQPSGLDQPMAIQPRATISSEEPKGPARNAVRISEGQPIPRRKAPNDNFVSPFEEPQEANATSEDDIVPDLALVPAPPEAALTDQQTVVDTAIAGQSAVVPESAGPETNSTSAAANPFQSVEIDTAVDAFRSVGKPSSTSAPRSVTVESGGQEPESPAGLDTLGEWRRAGTPALTISDSKTVSSFNDGWKSQGSELTTTASPVRNTVPAEEKTQVQPPNSADSTDTTDSGTDNTTDSEEIPEMAVASKPQSPRERLSAAIRSRTGERGFRGFCPVTLRDERDLVDSSPDISAAFGLRTYNFSSAAARQKFLANPTRYAPAAGGCDVVMLVNSGEEEEGSIEFVAWFRDRLYLFTSRETMTMFLRNSSVFADKY